jgi:hypothetical protein
MTHKIQKFCKISKFLEKHDKELYQVFDDLCLFPLLAIRNRGVTFLRPKDSEFRSKIFDAAYSQSPENAVDMLKTLILLEVLPDANSFDKHPIANASKNQLLVDSVKDGVVKMPKNHSAQKNKDFHPMQRSELSALFDLSGPGPLDVGQRIKLDNNERKVQGGNTDKRKELGLFVEDCYGKGDKEIYKAVMACLYKHAIDSGNNCRLLVDNMCASARASFYVIIEPHAENPSNGEITDLIDKTILTKDSYPESSKIFSKQYYNVRNTLIKRVYPDRNKVSNISKMYDDERNICIKSLQRAVDFKKDILSIYSKNNRNIAKDIFTIYCFLSTRNERDDVEYFKRCFCWVVRNIYQNPENLISQDTNDVAFNMSIYGNLLKSDVFMYVPFIHHSTLDENVNEARINHVNDLPEPTDLKTLFTIEQSSITYTQGGSKHSAEELNRFITDYN